MNRKPKKTRPPARLKSRHLAYIAVLPSLITLMNGVCGFVAIVYASKGPEAARLFPLFGGGEERHISYFSLAAYMLFLAMLADVLDGRVARLTKTTSSFGGQLDSLSDAISFGVAPAFLAFKLVSAQIERVADLHIRLFLIEGRLLLLFAIIYASCAIIRLARFNVENSEDESAHMNFSGLPTPPAAAVIISFVILHEHILYKRPGLIPAKSHALELFTLYAFPVILVFCGLLMVSRFKYPHIVNHLLRGKKPFAFFIALFLILLLLIWNIQFAASKAIIFAGFSLFMCSGPLRTLCSLRRTRRAAHSNSEDGDNGAPQGAGAP